LNLNLRSFDELEINESGFKINSVELDDPILGLPSNISDIHFISTDGLRLFLDNGIIQISDLELVLSSEFRRVEAQLAKVFNTSNAVLFTKDWDLNTIFGLQPLYYLQDSGSISRMGASRSINGRLNSPELLQPRLFGNVSRTAVEGLLNTGAVSKLDIFISIPNEYSYNFSIPPGYELVGKTPVNTEVPSGVGFTYVLNPKQRQILTLGSLKHPNYSSSLANINVVIDIREVDIQSLSEYVASVKITADGKLNYIRNEPGSKFDNALPKDITMEYYNSDALRLVYTEGLLDIEEIEEDLYSMIQENISNLLKEDVSMNVSFNDELLLFDGDTNNMDGSEPVTFSIRSSGKMRITGERNVRLGAFVTKRLELPLPGVKYWNVTYKLILPEHIQILGQPKVINGSVEYSGPIIDRNSDNRDELYITIYGEPSNSHEYRDESLEVNVEVDIDITLWFFLSKIIIPIILFIILCILIVMIKIYRRHKLKKIDKLKKDPDIIQEEDSGTPWSLDKSITPRRRTSLKTKDSHVTLLNSDQESSDNYSERLEELMPKYAMQRHDRGQAKGRGKGKRKGKAKSETRARGKKSRYRSKEGNNSGRPGGGIFSTGRSRRGSTRRDSEQESYDRSDYEHDYNNNYDFDSMRTSNQDRVPGRDQDRDREPHRDRRRSRPRSGSRRRY
jgi:hypothetical protein